MDPLSSTASNYVHAAGDLGQATLSLYNRNLLPLEVFAVLLLAGLIAAIVILIIKTGWLSLRVNRVRDVILKTDMPKKNAQAAWATSQKHFFAGDANDLKMAVVEADNILNDALRYAGIRGVNLGDRLKSVRRNQMPNLQDVWDAHKLRNEIAHETSFTLKRDMAEHALDAYKIALKNLGVLEE